MIPLAQFLEEEKRELVIIRRKQLSNPPREDDGEVMVAKEKTPKREKGVVLHKKLEIGPETGEPTESIVIRKINKKS